MFKKIISLVAVALFASGTAFAYPVEVPGHETTPRPTLNASLEGGTAVETGATPRQRALQASGTVSEAVFGDRLQILCQNNLSTIEASLGGDCCSRLDECRRALERGKVERNLPLDGLLNSMTWYANMPKWARITISGTVSAVIVGATIYLGTATAPK